MLTPPGDERCSLVMEGEGVDISMVRKGAGVISSLFWVLYTHTRWRFSLRESVPLATEQDEARKKVKAQGR